MIRLRYFASLRETLGLGDESIELPGDINDVASLTRWLQARGKPWQDALSDPRLCFAVNHTVAPANTPIEDGDEIAWFPPVTGG